MSTERYDVAIVGASIAGCTAAILFGRAGARVALLERHGRDDAFKRVCTHFIQSSAVPTVRRLGLTEPMQEAGALWTGAEFWTRWGWIRPPRDGARPSLNLRREKLDPLLRHTAAGTPGVELLVGQTVDGLLRAGGRVSGVESVGRDGRRRAIEARLVVAADGRDSKVAELADAKARVRPHNRFGYWAYYDDVAVPTAPRAQMWFLDPDVAYAFPTDDGLTLLACFLMKDPERVERFKRDPEGQLASLMESLPGGPRLSGARLASPVLGKLDMPNLTRPVALPGLAFVGDAALASDPLWGVGCGWAFQSAEWLVNATAGAVTGGGDVDRALRRYARVHRSRLRAYERLNCDYSTGRRLNPVERLLFSAAARDTAFAGHFEAFGTRNMPVRRFLSPRSFARAGLINARHALRRRARAAPQPA